ncbi:interleukin-1 receptor-like 1 [Pholidichthys leucotaenia]
MKEDDGIYTCVCTWPHNHKMLNSSGSMRLVHEEIKVFPPVQILVPSTREQIAYEGFETKLKCSVLCGTNAERDCSATWEINGKPFSKRDGYSQSFKIVTEKPSDNTIATAVLTIDRVLAKDFQNEYKCKGTNYYTTSHTTLILKQGESIIPLVVGVLCILLLCVFAIVLIKCFAIDIALFFRLYHRQSHNQDTMVYDAYVVYQTQSMDKGTEDKLARFVTEVLPSILEDKCGYRLFIRGRDDVPGEDHIELVEKRISQSRRLMIILTPGSGSGSENADQCPDSPQTSTTGGYDWQVGLHHALIQRELSVILIQVGDTGPQGYTHLPPGLQHLIRKNAPIRWPESSRTASAWNSRFWKRVRYLMPVTPAKKCTKSAVV